MLSRPNITNNGQKAASKGASASRGLHFSKGATTINHMIRIEVKDAVKNNDINAELRSAGFRAADLNVSADVYGVGAEHFRGITSSGAYYIVRTSAGDVHFPGVRTGGHLSRHISRITG